MASSGNVTKSLLGWRIHVIGVALLFLSSTGAVGEGLSDKFARLHKEGRSHTEISLTILKDVFLTESPNSHPTHLKVFAAGLPRSGTGSLALALTQLGYKPCHGPDGLALASVLGEHHAGRASTWDLIRHQEELGFDIQGLDFLGWKLFKEAAQMPEVKVILSLHPRGGLAWAESWSSFAPDHMHHFRQRPFRFSDSFVQVMKMNLEFLTYLSGNATDDPTDPYFAFPAPGLSDAYERHNEAVKAVIPEDRLLVFDPTQGWEPLCRFLEIEHCPTTPYPRMMDRQMMMTMTKLALVITWVWPLVLLATLTLPIILLRLLCCKTSKARPKTA